MEPFTYEHMGNMSILLDYMFQKFNYNYSVTQNVLFSEVIP